MAEYNTPNKYNYGVNSEVKVLIAKKISDGVYAPKRPIGNVNDGNFNKALEKLEHTTNLYGIDSKDDEFVTKTTVTMTMEIDELVKDNLSYVLGSSQRLTSQTADRPDFEVKSFSSGSMVVNNGQPIKSVIEIRPLSGEDEYDEGASADYTVDESTATITLTGSSDIGQDDKVIVTYEVTETSLIRYNIADNDDVEGRLYIVKTGGKGPKFYIYVPIIKITNEGDLNLLIKTEYRKATLNLELIQDPDEGFGYWYQW